MKQAPKSATDLTEAEIHEVLTEIFKVTKPQRHLVLYVRTRRTRRELGAWMRHLAQKKGAA